MRAFALAAVAAVGMAGSAGAATLPPFGYTYTDANGVQQTYDYGYQWVSDDGAFVFDAYLPMGQGFFDILHDPGLTDFVGNVGTQVLIAGDLQPLSVTGTTISALGITDSFQDYEQVAGGLCVYEGNDEADFSFDLFGGLDYTLTRYHSAPVYIGDPTSGSVCPDTPNGLPPTEVLQSVSTDGSWTAYGGAPPVPVSPVPLPASAPLLLAGFGLLAFGRFRR